MLSVALSWEWNLDDKNLLVKAKKKPLHSIENCVIMYRCSKRMRPTDDEISFLTNQGIYERKPANQCGEITPQSWSLGMLSKP